MKSIYAVLFFLIFLIVIMILAWQWSPVEFATGFPHPNPEFKGMYISKTNIDVVPHTKWLGYLFGLGIIGLFSSLLVLGNRKNGKATGIVKWIFITMIIYTIAFSGMVFSHWDYAANNGGNFFKFMPIPTAWMIIGIWSIPLILTAVYIVKFEDWIISDEEIKAFHDYLDNKNSKDN